MFGLTFHMEGFNFAKLTVTSPLLARAPTTMQNFVTVVDGPGRARNSFGILYFSTSSPANDVLTFVWTPGHLLWKNTAELELALGIGQIFLACVLAPGLNFLTCVVASGKAQNNFLTFTLALGFKQNLPTFLDPVLQNFWHVLATHTSK